MSEDNNFSKPRPEDGTHTGARKTKKERVNLILMALGKAPAASSRDDALALIAGIFREVENEHSGIPDGPFNKDRLYPPVAEIARMDGKPWLRSYRHTGHYSLIADNGAIVIRVFLREPKDGVWAIIGERTELDKPGSDGRTVADLE